MSISFEQWRGGLHDNTPKKKCYICKEYQDPLVVHPDWEQYKIDQQRQMYPKLQYICNTCKFKRECKQNGIT